MELPITFRLGRARDHDAARRSVEALSEEVKRRGGEGRPGPGQTAELVVHPALPPIGVALRDGGAVEVRASGWPGGPGFVEALHAMVRASAQSADVEADQIEGPPSMRAAIEHACEKTLVDAAKRGLAFLTAHPKGHLQLGLPRPERAEAVRLLGDPAGIYTLEGPREKPWLEALAAGGDPRGFYPWWHEPLDDPGARRLGAALAVAHLTWTPSASERQQALRKRALDELKRGDGASPELMDLRAALEKLANGEPANVPGLRHAPRVASLAGGWVAIVPGSFESEQPPPAATPPGVEPSPIHGDGTVRVEAMAQTAPAGSFAERADQLMSQPMAAQAVDRRRDDAAEYAGYAIERPTGGGVTLLASFAGAKSHLIARITVAEGGNAEAARVLFRSIAPQRPSDRFLAI